MNNKIYKAIAFIVPCNFAHKAGDGLSTRHHLLKNIHPALQANCGATQATYILEIEDGLDDKWVFQIQ